MSFENDVYSQEFFEFIIKILKGVTDVDDPTAKDVGLKLGKKVGFDILARCNMNSGLELLIGVLMDILKGSD